MGVSIKLKRASNRYLREVPEIQKAICTFPRAIYIDVDCHLPRLEMDWMGVDVAWDNLPLLASKGGCGSTKKMLGECKISLCFLCG